MRVNARLNSEEALRIKTLVQLTGLTVSDILKKALFFFFSHVQGSKSSAYEIFTKSGFIGGFSGRSDLSVKYKDLLTEGWRRKHGYR